MPSNEEEDRMTRLTSERVTCLTQFCDDDPPCIWPPASLHFEEQVWQLLLFELDRRRDEPELEFEQVLEQGVTETVTVWQPTSAP